MQEVRNTTILGVRWISWPRNNNVECQRDKLQQYSANIYTSRNRKIFSLLLGQHTVHKCPRPLVLVIEAAIASKIVLEVSTLILTNKAATTAAVCVLALYS